MSSQLHWSKVVAEELISVSLVLADTQTNLLDLASTLAQEQLSLMQSPQVFFPAHLSEIKNKIGNYQINLFTEKLWIL
jgi:hypothetical protein